MTGLLLTVAALALLLCGLPLAGVLLAGGDPTVYLEFPPVTRYVQHAPFSRAAFLALAAFVLAAIAPFVRAGVAHDSRKQQPAPRGAAFPWWGYGGLSGLAVFWVLAWTRFDWFAVLQHHTFFPLWCAYILTVNALTFKRIGRCMLVNRRGFFLLLFAASTVFWWFFEYLNRFVQNWYYTEVTRFSPAEYALLASLSFSTVLPAVLGTRELLLTGSFFKQCYGTWRPLRVSRPRLLGGLCLAAAAAGLTGIGLAPNFLYPLVWVAPFAAFIALQALTGTTHLFSRTLHGDWSLVAASAAAALVCGFFWELWNWLSLAKWIYAVPYVHRFCLFEMPLLGYAGYLPFGVGCAAVGEALERCLNGSSD